MEAVKERHSGLYEKEIIQSRRGSHFLFIEPWIYSRITDYQELMSTDSSEYVLA